MSEEKEKKDVIVARVFRFDPTSDAEPHIQETSLGHRVRSLSFLKILLRGLDKMLNL